MPFTEFDRHQVRFFPLRERENRVFIEQDHIHPDDSPQALTGPQQRLIEEVADRIVAARQCGAARMLTFGAHAIKNGLAPVMARLVEGQWITHLATNGAGIIHDWEFAFIGESSEHVAATWPRCPAVGDRVYLTRPRDRGLGNLGYGDPGRAGRERSDDSPVKKPNGRHSNGVAGDRGRRGRGRPLPPRGGSS